MKVSISKDGKSLIIEAPLNMDSPKETAKMFLVANSGGFTDGGVKLPNGQDLRLNLMAGYRKNG